MPRTGLQQHPLDPCGVVIVGNIDRDWRDQKEQTFYCHFECFRRMVNDDSVMYIMQPDFSTNGDGEDEGMNDDD
jgi:hypothetical protein